MGHERYSEQIKVSLCFCSCLRADTGNPIFDANSLVRAIKPQLRSVTMETSNSLVPLPSSRRPWNKGKLIGPKPPLRSKHVWSIRTKLQLEGRKRDLAIFNLAIDSKLRGCDVVSVKVENVAPNGYAIDRATVRQKKTGHPVRFEITEQTRQALDDYIRGKTDIEEISFPRSKRFGALSYDPPICALSF